MKLTQILNQIQLKSVDDYVNSLLSNTKFTATKFALQVDMDVPLAKKVLKMLVDLDVLAVAFVVRCPQCGLLLEPINEIASIEKEVFCYKCEEDVTIDKNDIEVIYTLKDHFFTVGQQNDVDDKLVTSAVLSEDSLTSLLQEGMIDLNSNFYKPSGSEIKHLIDSYNKVFSLQKTAVSKGTTLEDLTTYLFNLCKHFKASRELKLRPNQIDCYVRNTLYIPGITPIGSMDSFVIECKNETTTPKAGYMNKIHSIMRFIGKKFGIIISRCHAPKTFISLSNQIYLKDNMVIISIDTDDLKEIIMNRKNLLEMLERKIEEVKLNATKDLRKIGLYNA